MTQSLKKKGKLEEVKTYEYYAFKTSEDRDEDDIFDIVVGHAVSAVVSEMTSKLRKQRGKNKVRHSEFWEQGFIHWNDKEFKQRMRFYYLVSSKPKFLTMTQYCSPHQLILVQIILVYDQSKRLFRVLLFLFIFVSHHCFYLHS